MSLRYSGSHNICRESAKDLIYRSDIGWPYPLENRIALRYTQRGFGGKKIRQIEQAKATGVVGAINALSATEALNFVGVGVE